MGSNDRGSAKEDSTHQCVVDGYVMSNAMDQHSAVLHGLDSHEEIKNITVTDAHTNQCKRAGEITRKRREWPKL